MLFTKLIANLFPFKIVNLLLLFSFVFLTGCFNDITQGDQDNQGNNTNPNTTPISMGKLLKDDNIVVLLTGTDAEDSESSLIIEVTIQPANGNLDVITGSAPLTVIYTPIISFVGSDQFQFTVTDSSNAKSSPATVLLEVLPIVYYVQGTAAPGGDGLSWGTAYDKMEDAANIVQLAGQQVWVAGGTYIPALSNGTVLNMVSGVEYYGGFTGSETSLGNRPSPLTATYLSGDFNGDDVPGNPMLNKGDNSFHVVIGASNAILDGFIIRDGYGGGSGDNNHGGGIFNSNVTGLALSNIIISGNTGGNGGGIFNKLNSQITLNNVILSHNTGINGGGITNYDSSSPIMTNIVFVGNHSTNHGGAIYNNTSSSPILNYVAIFQNTVDGVGGGIFNNENTPTLNNVSFINNTSPNQGGGYYASGSSSILNNVLFQNNSGSPSGGGYFFQKGVAPPQTSIITNVTFTNNSTQNTGGGLFVTGASTTNIINAAFWGNLSSSETDIYAPPGSLNIENTCSQQNLTTDYLATNSVTLGVNPFSIGINNSIFLNQSGGCVNIGNDTKASAVGLDWSNLTTATTGILDSTPVDAGIHYHPNRVEISTLISDASDASWTTSNSTYCVLTNDLTNSVYQVPTASLTSGSFAHGLSAGTQVWMSCFGNGIPVVEAVTIP